MKKTIKNKLFGYAVLPVVAGLIGLTAGASIAAAQLFTEQTIDQQVVPNVGTSPFVAASAPVSANYPNYASDLAYGNCVQSIMQTSRGRSPVDLALSPRIYTDADAAAMQACVTAAMAKPLVAVPVGTVTSFANTATQVAPVASVAPVQTVAPVETVQSALPGSTVTTAASSPLATGASSTVETSYVAEQQQLASMVAADSTRLGLKEYEVPQGYVENVGPIVPTIPVNGGAVYGNGYAPIASSQVEVASLSAAPVEPARTVDPVPAGNPVASGNADDTVPVLAGTTPVVKNTCMTASCPSTDATTIPYSTNIDPSSIVVSPSGQKGIMSDSGVFVPFSSDSTGSAPVYMP